METNDQSQTINANFNWVQNVGCLLHTSKANLKSVHDSKTYITS